MTNRTRQVLFFVILVGVPIGAWAFVFHPRNQAISAARIDVDLKRAQLEELRELRGDGVHRGALLQCSLDPASLVWTITTGSGASSSGA